MKKIIEIPETTNGHLLLLLEKEEASDTKGHIDLLVDNLNITDIALCLNFLFTASVQLLVDESKGKLSKEEASKLVLKGIEHDAKAGTGGAIKDINWVGITRG